MKKWLIPLTFPFVTVIAFLLSGAVGALGNGDGTGYGGVAITLAGLIFYGVIVVPAMCIVYSKYCLSEQKFRFFFTLYQSLLISLPCGIPFFMSRQIVSIVYGAILFAWCEIWGLGGLIRWKRKQDR